MPIVLRMINTSAGSETKCIVRIPAIGQERAREENITQTPDPAHCIRKIMEGLVQKSGQLVTQGLLDQELEVEVHSPDVPTLELIDLPGIVEMPANLRDATRAMTKRYMEQPNNLILCTVMANYPCLCNSQAMGLVCELKVESRTIALLTKW